MASAGCCLVKVCLLPGQVNSALVHACPNADACGGNRTELERLGMVFHALTPNSSDDSAYQQQQCSPGKRWLP